METNKNLNVASHPEEVERIIAELRDLPLITNQEFIIRKQDIIDELDINGDELIPEPLHNIISHLAKFSQYFRDNGFIVTMARSYIKTTYLVIDGVWLHPLRVTKGKANDKLVIKPEKLEGYRLLYKESITQYIFRKYGFGAQKMFKIDVRSTTWANHFVLEADHPKLIVSFIQNEFEVPYNKFYISNNKPYVFVRALSRFVRKAYSTYFPDNTKHYLPFLKVNAGCGSDEVLFYWATIGDKYTFFYDDESRTFKIQRGSLNNVKVHFTMTVDDFLNKGYVTEDDNEYNPEPSKEETLEGLDITRIV